MGIDKVGGGVVNLGKSVSLKTYEMKKSIFLALGWLILISCSAQDTTININDLQNKKEVLTEYSKRFDILAQLTDFDNFEYSFESELNQGYIYGAAKDRDGNTVVFRITVNESDGKITLQASGAGSESCTGINCELCAFANNGGCTCKRVGSLLGGTPACNHAISR
jgi:hypothetical protein